MQAKRNPHKEIQIRATKALLKFCKDHQNSSKYLMHLEGCLVALERDNLEEAVKQFKLVPLGGNGCFNDWFPPVVFAHEDPTYVWTEFEALVSLWAHMMIPTK